MNERPPFRPNNSPLPPGQMQPGLGAPGAMPNQMPPGQPQQGGFRPQQGPPQMMNRPQNPQFMGMNPGMAGTPPQRPMNYPTGPSPQLIPQQPMQPGPNVPQQPSQLQQPGQMMPQRPLMRPPLAGQPFVSPEMAQRPPAFGRPQGSPQFRPPTGLQPQTNFAPSPQMPTMNNAQQMPMRPSNVRPLSPPQQQPPMPNTQAADRRRAYPEQIATAYQAPPPPAAAPQNPTMMPAMDSRFQQMNLNPNHSQSLSVPSSLIGTIAPVWELKKTVEPIKPASSKYFRSTLNSVPKTSTLLNKSKIPFGVILTPYPKNEDEVPTIAGPIVRCRRCRAYINPYVEFVDQGTRWKCNMCQLVDDVPSFFDYDVATQQMINRANRPELTHSVVEFLASSDYMVRPPQPPVYLFVIETTYEAINSGMVATVARTILDSLDRIPNESVEGRTRIGFITFDSSIHFYNLNENLSEPQMIVVSDLKDPVLPFLEDSLVSLSSSRKLIEAFLNKLANLFVGTKEVGNAFGPAMSCASKLLSSYGGTICSFVSTLPSSHEGALKQREDIKLRGTSKEGSLLEPADHFYKDFATDCSRTQISVNLFLFPSHFIDLSTLCCCTKYTGGALFYYPGFNAGKMEDAVKVGGDISRFLSMKLGYEAVVRVRASKGLQLSSYHGNFFLRSTDLLSFPNTNPMNSLSVGVVVEENISTPTVCFQVAVLHTNWAGERRIRVINFALPVVESLNEIFTNADQKALVHFLSVACVEKAMSGKLDDARDAIFQKCVEVLTAYKQAFSSGGQSQQLVISENLRLFPLLILALLKNVILSHDF